VSSRISWWLNEVRRVVDSVLQHQDVEFESVLVDFEFDDYDRLTSDLIPLLPAHEPVWLSMIQQFKDLRMGVPPHGAEVDENRLLEDIALLTSGHDYCSAIRVRVGMDGGSDSLAHASEACGTKNVIRKKVREVVNTYSTERG